MNNSKIFINDVPLQANYSAKGMKNSRQRTFTTAKYFSAGFLPFANVERKQTRGRPEKSLCLMVVVPDEQGNTNESQDKFEDYDKDVLHSGNEFIS